MCLLNFGYFTDCDVYVKLEKNMLEAAQPKPPPTYEFLKFMYAVVRAEQSEEKNQPENVLFPEEYVSGPALPKPKYTMRNEVMACKIGLDYQKIVDGENACLDDVDDWFCGLAKFLMHPTLLHDARDAQEMCLDNRENLCDKYMVQMHSVSAFTFTTHVNAILRAVKSQKGPALVHSCTRTFPRFNALMGAVMRRYV